MLIRFNCNLNQEAAIYINESNFCKTLKFSPINKTIANETKKRLQQINAAVLMK